MRIVTAFALLASCVLAQLTPRKVDCSHAEKPGNATLMDLYFNTLFDRYQDSSKRLAKSTIVFEALDGLAAVRHNQADLLEFLVAMRQIEEAIMGANTTVDDIEAAWVEVWNATGSRALAAAQEARDKGLTATAAAASGRAATYLLLAERYMNHSSPAAHQLYLASIEAFKQSLDDSAPCQPVSIPYKSDEPQATTTTLHGYWCKGSGPALVVMTGYDGTAEMSLQSVGFTAARRGHNVLVFDGPGQGYAARVSGLRFRADWEVVTDQVLQWLSDVQGVSDAVFWGRSFGGYLAPRAFAAGGQGVALVADGGVLDFYQTFVCSLPEDLRSVWYAGETEAFDAAMNKGAEVSLSLRFIGRFGTLGFGATTFSQLFWAVQNYTLAAGDVLKGVGTRPVLTMQPALEQMTGNQSALFFAALPPGGERTLLQLGALSGAALHCGVGSTAVAIDAQLDWVQQALA